MIQFKVHICILRHNVCIVGSRAFPKKDSEFGKIQVSHEGITVIRINLALTLQRSLSQNPSEGTVLLHSL